MAAAIPLGMLGGGPGSGIGETHRIAARLDNQFSLVAGVFCSDAEKSKRFAHELGIAPDRAYGSYQEMAEAEGKRADGIQAVAIATPNDLHAPMTECFLDAQIDVICDKPLTTTINEAERLEKRVAESGRVFVLTHNYSGYPLIREARERIARGELGRIRIVQAEYPQQWLSRPLEQDGHKQAVWRANPARSGSGCLGDIGTHAYHLLSFTTQLVVEQLAAELHTFVDKRAVDDNMQVMLRFGGGARGAIWASQVAVGIDNGLRLRVYGEDGSIEWQQSKPNYMRFARYGEPPQYLGRGGVTVSEEARRITRPPEGHPDEHIEAFATIYREAAALIRANRHRGSSNDTGNNGDHGNGAVFGSAANSVPPGIADGLAGMRFVDACIRSSMQNSAWVNPLMPQNAD